MPADIEQDLRGSNGSDVDTQQLSTEEFERLLKSNIQAAGNYDLKPMFRSVLRGIWRDLRSVFRPTSSRPPKVSPPSFPVP